MGYIGMEFLLAPFNITTEPRGRNVPAAQVSATPHHELFVELHVEFLWEIVIGRGAEEIVLARDMPVVPNESFGVQRHGIGKTFIKDRAKRPSQWGKAIQDLKRLVAHRDKNHAEQ